MNFEFKIEEAPISFRAEELDAMSRAIHEKAIRQAQRYLVSKNELLESIIEVDGHKIYEKFGFVYLTTYCVKFLGLDQDDAGILVRIARKSQVLPEFKHAVVDGDVSISNARIIASVINSENSAEWLEKAKTLSKHNLEREVASINPGKAKAEKARRIGDGRVQIVLNLSEEEYERRCAVKNLVSQSLRKSASDSEVEVAMIECYEFHKDPVRKAERAAKRKCKESGKTRVASTAETDKIPAHVQHVVNLRDKRACQARNPDGSICGCKLWTHLHHIVPRSQGGLSVPENLITLCSSHHRLWHKRMDL